MEKNGDDSSALIEFTCEKQECQITLCNLKIKISHYICMQKDQNNHYLHLLLQTFKLFQIKIVLSPLKLFLRTRSDNA